MTKITQVFAILFFMLPSVSSAAALTPQQSSSLIAVVQSSPGIPASAFVSLITAFSNITVTQATSLITVVQAAPSVPADAFVNLLTSFTADTPATQPATPATNQAVTPTIVPNTTSVIPATTPTATTQPTTPTAISTQAQVIGPAPQFIQTPTITSVVQTTQYDSSGRITGGYPAYTVGWTTNIPATVEIRRLYYSTNNLGGEIVDPKYYQGELGGSAPLGTVTATTTSASYTSPPYTSISDLVIVINANGQQTMWVGKLY